MFWVQDYTSVHTRHVSLVARTRPNARSMWAWWRASNANANKDSASFLHIDQVRGVRSLAWRKTTRFVYMKELPSRSEHQDCLHSHLPPISTTLLLVRTLHRRMAI